MFKTPIPLSDFPELAIGKLCRETGAQLAAANVVSTIFAASEVAALKLFVIGWLLLVIALVEVRDRGTRSRARDGACAAQTTAGDTPVNRVVSQNPEILRGDPVFTGTRVPVKSLFDHLEAGDSIRAISRRFPERKVRASHRSPGRSARARSLRAVDASSSGRKSRLAIAGAIWPPGEAHCAPRSKTDRSLSAFSLANEDQVNENA